MAIIKQIASIVNDAVTDALGTDAIKNISTTDFVSMGKAIDAANAYENFYGSLVNRLSGTILAVREYNSTTRGILRDEDAFGAFKQKVHYNIATAVNNPAHEIPTVNAETGARTYTQ